jgi:hypothetical protein
VFWGFDRQTSSLAESHKKKKLARSKSGLRGGHCDGPSRQVHRAGEWLTYHTQKGGVKYGGAPPCTKCSSQLVPYKQTASNKENNRAYIITARSRL